MFIKLHYAADETAFYLNVIHIELFRERDDNEDVAKTTIFATNNNSMYKVIEDVDQVRQEIRKAWKRMKV